MSDDTKLSSRSTVDTTRTIAPNPPDPPDPTYPVAKFLSWLIKRGSIRRLSECKKKWGAEGLDIESIVKELSPQYIGTYRYKGEKIVKLEDQVWASQWISYYDLEVPHHRHKKRLEKIFSVTESKTKV